MILMLRRSVALYLPHFFAACFVAVALTSIAYSQELVKQVSGDGAFRTINVPADYAGRYVTIYYLSKGNMSQRVGVEIAGPAGANASIKSAVASGKLSALLANPKAWNSIKMKSLSGKDVSSFTFTGSKPAALLAPDSQLQPSALRVCDTLSPEELALLIQEMTAGRPDLTLTKEDVCRIFGDVISDSGFNVGDNSSGGSGGISVPNGGADSSSFSGTFLLHKDTCGVSSSGKYIVRFDFRLDKVDPAIRHAGFTVGVGVRGENYSGEMASSIKPKSDGRFAPQPLFLMSSIGGYGGEKINVVKWSKGKISSQKSTGISDYVSYGGLFLSRTPAGKFLTGGKGTLEVSSGDAIYSVCFNLVKKRQSVHGYPK